MSESTGLQPKESCPFSGLRQMLKIPATRCLAQSTAHTQQVLTSAEAAQGSFAIPSGSRVIGDSNGQNGSHPFTVARQIPCNLLNNKSIQMLTRVSCRVAFALPHLATRLLILFMGCSMQCFLQTMPVESRVATLAKKTSSLELRFISQQTHA